MKSAKKLLCLILVVISVVTIFSVPVSAATYNCDYAIAAKNNNSQGWSTGFMTEQAGIKVVKSSVLAIFPTSDTYTYFADEFCDTIFTVNVYKKNIWGKYVYEGTYRLNQGTTKVRYDVFKSTGTYKLRIVATYCGSGFNARQRSLLNKFGYQISV